MTNHAVLAGSVLAGVALWAAVYAALLPKGGPDRAETRTAVTRVSSADPAAGRDDLSPGPGRWADLPRAAAKRPVTPPVDAEAPPASRRPDVDARQADPPLRRRARIWAAALRASPLAQHLTRQPAYRAPRLFARPRFRRVREPIQFSLATRSSS